jgi:hypothetical protein
MTRLQICIFVAALAFLAMPGCQHIGPRTIMVDRIPYNEAIANSWKQQTLLNIVRLRYMDSPEFVDVSSIVGGYEHARTVSGGLGTEIYPRDSISNFLAANLGGTRAMVDRPTISYSPQTGSEFTRNLTNPILPISILNLIESGYPADVVLELAVESINGIRNRGYAGNMQQADPEFQSVLQLVQQAQASGHVSLRISPSANKNGSDVVMVIRDEDITPDVTDDRNRLRTILRLDPEVDEFKVVFGMLPKAKNEIAFRTRSVLRILGFLALNVQVPECHLADGRAPDLGDTNSPTQPQLTVLSGCEPPCDTFAAVCYQGYWFWVDQRDFHSKRTFAYLKILLALADTEQKSAAPALTIRAN